MPWIEAERAEPFQFVKLKVADVEAAVERYVSKESMRFFGMYLPKSESVTCTFSLHRYKGTMGMSEQPVPVGAVAPGELAGCVGYSPEQATLVLCSDGSPASITEFSGRHAISLPQAQLKAIYAGLGPDRIVHELDVLQEQLGEVLSNFSICLKVWAYFCPCFRFFRFFSFFFLLWFWRN